jgi:iron complex transport system substrate-binding protein
MSVRVVTLLPSATEVVCALGVDPVGVSHECDHPPRVAELPSVNRSRVDPEASAAEINRQVVEAERGGGVYEIDLQTLADLDPDLVVTQGVCDVCAVDSVLVEAAVAETGVDAEVLTTDPHSLADVLGDIERVGRALDRADRAAALVGDLRERVRRVGERVPAAPPAAAREDLLGAGAADDPDPGSTRDDPPVDGPRVAVLDWTAPPMVAGHWLPGMVEYLGGEYPTDRGAPSRVQEWATIREYDPEHLVVAPCGFSVDQTRENLTDLTERPGWDDLTAVREGRVFVVDGHDYSNCPGPRLVDTLEYLAWTLYPGRFERPPEDAVVPLAALTAQVDAD